MARLIGSLVADTESTGAELRDPTLHLRQAGLPVSTGLHVLALAVLALLVHPEPLPQIEQVITVDLVSLPQAAPEPVGFPPSEAQADEVVAPDSVAPTPSEMIEATQMLAGAALADPRNAEARAMLDLIVPSVRREQVCGIEAMEQIKAGAREKDPECVISYALAPVEIAGDTVTATGAAVQMGADWYRLEYACTLGGDLASISAFSYRVGAVIPADERDRLGLAPCM